METCPYSRQISSYHDGELPAEQSRQLEEHLASGCAPCQAELGQWGRLSLILKSGPAYQLSEHAREALYRLAPVVSEAGFIRVAKWAIGLAASVMVAVSGWMMFNRTTAAPAVAVSQPWVQVAINPNQSLDAVATRIEIADDGGSDAQFSDWAVSSFDSSGNHE